MSCFSDRHFRHEGYDKADLPGPLMCHLPGPVYSSKGVLLMEAGTQVIGQYQSLKNNGVGRLLERQWFAARTAIRGRRRDSALS